MSAQDNKQVVIEGYQLFQQGDITSLLDRYHDDAEWVAPDGEFVPFAGSFRGKAQIAQFFQKLDANVQATRFEPQAFIAEGDQVVVTGRATWLAKPTGRSFDTDWVHVFTLRDGKIVRFDSYYDSAASEKAFQPDQPGDTRTGQALRH